MNVEELMAAHKIQNVWSTYARHMDKQEMEKVLGLFTSDCHVDLADWGVYEGEDELRAFLEGFFAGEMGIQDSFHAFFNPIIEVDDDEATGQWHYIGADTFDGPTTGWLFGFYRNEFVVEDSEWRIDRLVFDGKWFTSYDVGWAEERTCSVERRADTAA